LAVDSNHHRGQDIQDRFGINRDKSRLFIHCKRVFAQGYLTTRREPFRLPRVTKIAGIGNGSNLDALLNGEVSDPRECQEQSGKP
jgi:hypothetical protein